MGVAIIGVSPMTKFIGMCLQDRISNSPGHIPNLTSDELVIYVAGIILVLKVIMDMDPHVIPLPPIYW
jgi:hypothetical protein